MKERISRGDIETLSAYLDGELSSGDRARLETRLHTKPELRVLLVSLQQTRAVLRNTPCLRAPRNFTLTPAMIGQRSRFNPLSFFLALRFSSVLAALLFVGVVLAEPFASRRGVMPAKLAEGSARLSVATEVLPPAMEMPLMASGQVTETTLLPTPTVAALQALDTTAAQTFAVVPTQNWLSNGSGSILGTGVPTPPAVGWAGEIGDEGEGGLGGGSPPESAGTRQLKALTPTQAGQRSAAGTLPTPAAAAETAALAPAPATLGLGVVSPTIETGAQADAMLTPIAPQAKALPTQEITLNQTLQSVETQRAPLSGWWLAEAVLGGIALLTGAAAIGMQRKRNP